MMVPYKPMKFREMIGDYNCQIVDVEVAANQYYDPKKENSMQDVLNITFQTEDKETKDAIMYTQKFVSLLTGKGLFQQLLDIVGVTPEVDGGEFDTDQLLGLNVIATFEKNKKGYNTIISVMKNGEKTAVEPVTDGVQDSVSDPEKDLPF